VNRFDLAAVIIECQPMRYTPVGLPVLELVLQHDSEQIEAGMARKVSCTLDAVALGDLAVSLQHAGAGSVLQARGFLAATRKGSMKVKFHLQQARVQPANVGIQTA